MVALYLFPSRLSLPERVHIRLTAHHFRPLPDRLMQCGCAVHAVPRCHARAAQSAPGSIGDILEARLLVVSTFFPDIHKARRIIETERLGMTTLIAVPIES